MLAEAALSPRSSFSVWTPCVGWPIASGRHDDPAHEPAAQWLALFPAVLADARCSRHPRVC